MINIEKSRFVREKSKIPITVTFAGGIATESGLLDLAIEGGFISKIGQFANLLDIKTGQLDEKKVRPKNIPASYWESFVTYEPFQKFITEKYTLGLRQMISNGQEEIAEDEDDD